MIQCILSGCNGRMGKVITELCEGDPDFRIVAGVDVAGKPAGDYPVYGSFDEIREKADVCIDFSSPKAFDSMMDYAVKTGTAAVICTTGLSEEQIHRIELESAKIAVLRSANMSLGVNLLLGLVREAAEKLSKRGFDIEIVERHHNQKRMRPAEPRWLLRKPSMRAVISAIAMPMTAPTVWRCAGRMRSGSARSGVGRFRVRMR